MRTVLTHLAMAVQDVGESVAFYRDYCGMVVVHAREGEKVTWLAEPGREHELILVLLVRQPCWWHASLRELGDCVGLIGRIGRAA